VITLEQALKAVPQAAKLRVASFLPYLNSAMQEFEINTPLRQAAFLSQVFHESGNLSAVEENLNYGAAGLQATWPSRFDAATAAAYQRKPEKIANKVYANRMGNRDESSGDGWKYRGAGLIQLTGKDNQFACAMALNIDPTTVADWLKTEEGACRSAGHFWRTNNLNKWADKGDIDGVSDVVNLGRKTDKVGDAIGYAHRKALYDAFKRVLGAV
jgi:putative chitinase